MFIVCQLVFFNSFSAGIATEIVLLFLKTFTIITIPQAGQLQESQFVKNLKHVWLQRKSDRRNVVCINIKFTFYQDSTTL